MTGGRRTGRAGLAIVVPVGLFGGAMLGLATGSGKLQYLIEHLPLTPTPNGLTLLALVVVAAGCWWRMTRAETTAHESIEQAFDMSAGEKWPRTNAWFGTPAATLDPDDAATTLLPDPDGRVRS